MFNGKAAGNEILEAVPVTCAEAVNPAIDDMELVDNSKPPIIIPEVHKGLMLLSPLAHLQQPTSPIQKYPNCNSA